jgi:hypothetical protein
MTYFTSCHFDYIFDLWNIWMYLLSDDLIGQSARLISVLLGLPSAGWLMLFSFIILVVWCCAIHRSVVILSYFWKSVLSFLSQNIQKCTM